MTRVVLLTVQEAAERMAVSPRTVRARMREGRLAYVQERRGTAVRIPEQAVVEYLASFTRPATTLPAPSPPTPSNREPIIATATRSPRRAPSGSRVVRLWDP
jgi:excisionase family DNA binding protein